MAIHSGEWDYLVLLPRFRAGRSTAQEDWQCTHDEFDATWYLLAEPRLWTDAPLYTLQKTRYGDLEEGDPMQLEVVEETGQNP